MCEIETVRQTDILTDWQTEGNMHKVIITWTVVTLCAESLLSMCGDFDGRDCLREGYLEELNIQLTELEGAVSKRPDAWGQMGKARWMKPYEVAAWMVNIEW